MSRTILSRLGAGLFATALVAVGTVAFAAPASAAGEINVLANDTYAAGNWGTGIDLTGSLYPADTEVTVLVGSISEDVLWGETTVTTDADGEFTLPAWIPEDGPYETEFAGIVINYVFEGETVFVDPVELTITPFVALAQSVTVTPTCSSATAVTADGVTVVATGFGQGEAVTDSTTAPDGTPYTEVSELVADASGTVTASFTLTGDIQTGTYTETLLGESGLQLTGTFVVGECGVPVVVPVVVPAAVATPAVLAATGASETGTIVAGGAMLLLAGAVLLLARRRTSSIR